MSKSIFKTLVPQRFGSTPIMVTMTLATGLAILPSAFLPAGAASIGATSTNGIGAGVTGPFPGEGGGSGQGTQGNIPGCLPSGDTPSKCNNEPAPVPEPASMLGILAFGALGGGQLLKKRKQQATQA